MRQFDIILQFFTGVHNEDMSYCDDVRKIALYNLASITGFWFDCVTSIPFSYIDLNSLEVAYIEFASQRHKSTNSY